MNDLNVSYSNDELSITNIQFLGLTQKAWGFSRGARTERVYEYPTGEAGVKDVYAYTLIDGGRKIESITRTLQWLDKAGNIFLTKDISPDLNIKNLKNLNREVRQGRIDYMEAAAEELAALASVMPEPYATSFQEAADSIDVIMTYYEKEINHYIQRGTLEFENAIRNETNPVMSDILALMVRPPDAEFLAGLTVKQTMLHQLTGEYNP